ncbi:MAG: OB-fold nucleic acid binding domain-containing protein [Prevotella sp.]|nr:OB-fold nucleic acid binding domain-containing protein [Prevotella sp.]
MKKIFKTMLAVAIAAFTFTSCEDVPEPYELPGSGTETPEVPSTGEAVGDGTLENPFNSVAANNYVASLPAGAESDKDIYIKGKVVSVKEQFSTQFGNATFYISDDGTSKGQFYVFRTFYLGNKKYTDGENIKVGDEVIICGKVTNYMGNTPETVTNKSYIYSLNGKTADGGSDTPTTGEAKGNGTLDNPYNSIAANQLASSLADGAESEAVYIKGKIASIKEEFSTQFGNATFYISDDGTDNGTFYVFRTFYLGNQKYSGGENIKVGDEVIIYGKVCNYMGNTPETVQNGSYLYSLNGKTAEGGSDTPTDGAKGDGTLENPYNSIAANSVASALKDDEQSDVVYIKGKVATIREQYGTQYGNATFTISDDGTTNGEFLVFRALYLNNVKYTEGEVLHVGDDVVVCGKLCNYMGNTPETVTGEAYLYSLKCNGGTEEPENPGGGDDADGKSITLVPSEMGYENAAEMTTITLSDGTTITFDGGGNQNTPKYYNTGKGIRMYPKNSMKVSSSKKIASIVMTCDVYNGTTYNASGDLQANPGTVKVADDIVTFDAINSNDCTITNVSETTGAPSQVRMTQLKIVYAE